MKRRLPAKRPNPRRSVERRLGAIGRKVEDRALGVADRALDVVEQNVDRWLDAAVGRLLGHVGLAPPETITVKDGEKMIELVRQTDGSYGPRR